MNYDTWLTTEPDPDAFEPKPDEPDDDTILIDEPTPCLYCNGPITDPAYEPYCGAQCAIDAMNEGDGR